MSKEEAERQERLEKAKAAREKAAAKYPYAGDLQTERGYIMLIDEKYEQRKVAI